MKSINKTLLTGIVMICWILLLLLLPGCSKQSTAPNSGGQLEINVDGLWLGGFVFKEGDNVLHTMPVSALISPERQAFFLVPQQDYLFDFNLGACGNLQKTNSLINGVLDIFQDGRKAEGQLEISNGKVIRTTKDDTIIYSFVADFSGGAEPFNGTGEVILTRMDTMYNQPASLSAISGHWSFYDEDGETFIDIPSNGNFTGGNTGGCQFSGKIEVINPTKNLYQIKSWTIANCGLPWDGSYYGLASLVEDEFHVVMVKQDHSFGFFMIFSR